KTGIITTVVGNGTASFGGDGGPAIGAGLNTPRAIALDGAGNLFISDTSNNRVRKVDAGTGIITTVAGNGNGDFGGDGGPAVNASLSFPIGIALDISGNLFIADPGNNRVRRVDVKTGFISTFAGNGRSSFTGDGGPAVNAGLNTPTSLAIDSSGNLFISDPG